MPMHELGTLQRHALSQWFGRRDFTPEEVALLDYAVVEQLPKIGKKGIEAIRAWLGDYGYDLRHPPGIDNRKSGKRLRHRLEHAERLLVQHGYRVDRPR